MWGLREGQANISSRASLIAKPNDSPYYIGLDRVFEDSYDSLKNPNGIIQLVLSENRLSQDLIEKWFSQNFNDSILGREGSGALSINGIATYQPFDGMPKLKEALSKTLLILLLGKKRGDGSSDEYEPNSSSDDDDGDG
ncbi:hypothetical protein CsSME_00027842 [Camellia sinensis var. sinensis]